MFVIGPTPKNGFAVRAGGPLAVACSDASRYFCISFVVAIVFSKLFVVLYEIVSGFLGSPLSTLFFIPDKYRDLPFKDQVLLWQAEIPV
jgi:hypothetical protein